MIFVKRYQVSKSLTYVLRWCAKAVLEYGEVRLLSYGMGTYKVGWGGWKHGSKLAALVLGNWSLGYDWMQDIYHGE